MPVTSGSPSCPALTPSIWAGVSLTGAARAAEVIRPSANAEAKIVFMVLLLSWWMPVTGLGRGCTHPRAVVRTGKNLTLENCPARLEVQSLLRAWLIQRYRKPLFTLSFAELCDIARRSEVRALR